MMIHTPLTILIEFVAAIPAMVAPNVLPRGSPAPPAPDGQAPNRTEKAGVWAGNATETTWTGGHLIAESE